MKRTARGRRLPIGAEVQPDGVHFRVWAPGRKKVEVILAGGPGAQGRKKVWALEREENGYFAGLAEQAGDGTLYRFRLSRDLVCPDPASRMQPDGIDGPSQVVDPALFRWTDHEWPGTPRDGQVLYEMHVGSFTEEGTWDAAARHLGGLAELGITVLELMPVAEFPGRFGWGYDGVFLYAPTRLYGTPDDFRRFVDRAHATGLGVILDVVYNHIGPLGNCLPSYSEDYFSRQYTTDWGKAINYDGPNSAPVREFFVQNAGYWIEEFHLDGLRLDATQNIYDGSATHIIAEISCEVRKKAGGRSTLIIGENEPQQVRLVRPFSEGGYGLDALWNDDFHHTARVALTGRREAYFTDYRGTPQELISALRWGYLYQGQYYVWQQKRRGTPALDLPASCFVTFIENHDQLANSSFGQRVHNLTSPGRHRAMTALLLLAPPTPMLFQGQEYGLSKRFQYFADYDDDLGESVREGRLEFLAQFKNLASQEAQGAVADPCDMATFEQCKLTLKDRNNEAASFLLHRDLLRLRKTDPVFSQQRNDRVFGAVLGAESLLIRFFGENGDDRLLIVNLGQDLELIPAPEPLLAPPEGTRWEILWSSDDPAYGGNGIVPFDGIRNVRISGQAAIALKAVEENDGHDRD